MVAESVVFHVDADKIIETRSRKAEDARDFFGVKEVRGLVPVDPHTTEVVSEEIVQGISGEERQTVWDPVSLIRSVKVVWLGPLAQIANGLGALLVGTGPNAKGNAVEGMGGILLEDEGVVDAVGLAFAGANFDIVREAGLRNMIVSTRVVMNEIGLRKLTLMAACRERAISLSCSSLGLEPRISGSQNWPTAPFMCVILPCAGCGALTHCEGSLPTPQTM